MTAPSGSRPTVVFWGTYDLGKPRVRILLEGARRAGIRVIECHEGLWEGIEDKSEIKGLAGRLRFPLRWLGKLPGLVWRYLRLPAHDAVVVPYLGQFDVLALWPWARLRRKKVYWDAFLSLYDTVVLDRQRLAEGSLPARGLWILEWLACRAAHRVFLDTESHARAFEEMFRLPPGSVGSVRVGAEDLFQPGSPEEAPAPRSSAEDRPLEVLFYGQFIPLHGIDTILDAAALLESRQENVRWTIIGTGQEAPRLDERLRREGLSSVRRQDWVSYGQLPNAIRRADVCLGIFGRSDKASRVIPNKVFQILATGRPLVTADTPGIRELLEPGPRIALVPPGDAEALARAVVDLGRRSRSLNSAPSAEMNLPRVDASMVGDQLAQLLFPEVADKDHE